MMISDPAPRASPAQADNLRTLLAPNASPMTLDGTRTYLVGRAQVAVIDPGPDDSAHIGALVTALRDASRVSILLTHLHPDHAAGAGRLAAALGGVSFGPAIPSPDDAVVVDGGRLVPVPTPGHTPDHVALHWPEAEAIFCGDLMMGGLDTALVAAGEGHIGAYLDSLERLRALRPKVIYPAHGPHFTDPDAALDRYRAHRLDRERQVLDALAAGARGLGAIAERVYGAGIDQDLRHWVGLTVAAYLEHLERTGRVRPEEWQ